MARFTLTRPKTESQKKFFNDYLPLTLVLSAVGVIAQIFSGFTESVVFFNAAYSNFSPIMPANGAKALSVVVMILGVALIEMGLRVLLPYAIRSILKKWLNITKLRGVIGWASIVACIGLIYFSCNLSFNGSKESMVMLSNDFEGVSTDSLKIVYDGQILAINQQYSKDSLSISSDFDNNRETIVKSFDSQVKSVRNSIYLLSRKEKNEGVSYASKKSQLYGTKSEIEGNKTAALLAHDQSKRDALKQLKLDRKESIEEIKNTTGSDIKGIESNNEKEENEHNDNISSKGASLGYFVIAAIIVLIISVLVKEMHMKGSGIEIQYEVVDFYYRQPIFASWKQAISERLEGILRRQLHNFTEKTEHPALPVTPAVQYKTNQESANLEYEVIYENGVNKDTGKREVKIHLESPQFMYDSSRQKNDGSRNDSSRRKGGRSKRSKSDDYISRNEDDSSRNTKNDSSRNKLNPKKGYMIKECESCGDDFYTKSHNAKYCKKKDCTRQEQYVKRKQAKGEPVPNYLLNNLKM